MKTISKAEWDKIHNDHKEINQSNKQAYILQFVEGKGTCSIPVIIKQEIAEFTQKHFDDWLKDRNQFLKEADNGN